jgi:ClpP class serine protease
LEEVVEGYQPLEAQKLDLQNNFNVEALMRKAKKAKELKEENKKLKKLLQIQLENTEKVREETQKTIKTLREEFVALVQEMQMQQVYRN